MDADNFDAQSITGDTGSDLSPTQMTTGPSNSGTQAQVKTTIMPYRCHKCGKRYQTKCGLAKHAKDCDKTQRRKCNYCDKEFDTFLKLRAHENKTHNSSYLADEEANLKPSEATFCTNR